MNRDAAAKLKEIVSDQWRSGMEMCKAAGLGKSMAQQVALVAKANGWEMKLSNDSRHSRMIWLYRKPQATATTATTKGAA